MDERRHSGESMSAWAAGRTHWVGDVAIPRTGQNESRRPDR